MSIKESALTAITAISNSDFVRAVTSAGASRRITVANLAKQIVEGYAGSSLAGSSQSVKSAIDSLNSKSLVGLQTTEVPSGSSRTMTISGHGILVFMGATTSSRGMYIASGYGSSIEIAEVRAVAEGTISISGTTMTISNTTNWAIRVAFVRLI